MVGRSIVFYTITIAQHIHSFLVAGLPFALLKHAVGPALRWLGLISHPSAVLRGHILLYLPRAVMVAISFIQGRFVVIC